MSNLAALTDRVEADLMDSANAHWSAAEIAGHLRRALVQINLVCPRRTSASVDVDADNREVSLSALTGLMVVVDVWYPYDSSDPVHPPERPSWSMLDGATLYLEVDDNPSGDDQARVFYTLPHTIEDLDSATTTTLDALQEEAAVVGATAYAAMALAQSQIGTITVNGWTPRQWHDWAQDRRGQFMVALDALRRRAVIMLDGRTHWELG